MTVPLVNVQQAKTHLSRLLAQVEQGDEVIIARNGEPVARLVSLKPRARREFGALAGRLHLDDSFFEPLPESELAAWET